MNKEKEIKKLTKEWYNLVIKGSHYKDRDCHWIISKYWSYGKEPNYLVEHNGYIYEKKFIECGSYEEAQDKLIELLKEAIINNKHRLNVRE